MLIEPGCRLGAYEITSWIGAGGMGEVWKAYDARLQRTVAIKVLKDQGADAADRILAEARAASGMSHPHICTVHDVAEADGRAFIVMEHIEGKPLCEAIPAMGLPTEQVVRYGVQIADALAHAHDHGVVHRDLKSANVVITSDGRAKVLDFGVADRVVQADVDAVTAAHTSACGHGVVGTIAYMSPELLRGEPATTRTDIWALGVLLFEMASGRLPFSGLTQTDVVSAVVRDTPALPTQVSPGLRTIIQRCLAKEAGQRYGQAAAVQAALEAVQSGTDELTPHAVEKTTAVASMSIAVLPFTNLSPDPEQQFFCDGLTDEIITDLSQLRGLVVISRSSSQQLKDSGNLKTVAAALKVRYVLDGSVRKAADAVRVTARLVDPARDEHLWAEKYSGRLEDVFDIQERISRSIVDALKVQLSPEEDSRLGEHAFTNVEAFECYHRARQEIYTFSAAGLDRALELVDKAVAISGENELLLATKGSVYFQYVNAALKPDEGYIQQAEACATRILSLKPDSAHGFSLLGLVRLSQARHAQAIRLFRRALAIDPASWYAALETARAYEVAGRYAESRASYGRSLAVDPLSPIAHSALMSLDLIAGDFGAVQRRAPDLLRAAPPFAYARWVYAMSLVHTNQRDEAIAVLDAAPDEPTPTIAGVICRFLLLVLQGEREAALSCVSPDFQARARRVEWWSEWIAQCYALMGEHGRAIDWLENAVDRGYIDHPYFAEHGATWRRLGGNARFQALLDKVKPLWERFEA
jgi:serine/threonine protein kinase